MKLKKGGPKAGLHGKNYDDVGGKRTVPTAV